MLSSCLPVCLSVTRRYCANTSNRRTTQSARRLLRDSSFLVPRVCKICITPTRLQRLEPRVIGARRPLPSLQKILNTPLHVNELVFDIAGYHIGSYFSQLHIEWSPDPLVKMEVPEVGSAVAEIRRIMLNRYHGECVPHRRAALSALASFAAGVQYIGYLISKTSAHALC